MNCSVHHHFWECGIRSLGQCYGKSHFVPLLLGHIWVHIVLHQQCLVMYLFSEIPFTSSGDQHLIFFLNLILANFHPPASSHDSSQLRRVKANTCFLLDIWCNPDTSFQIADHTESQGCRTHSEVNTIHALLHAWVHRCPWLDGVAVTDRIVGVCHPSYSRAWPVLHSWISGHRWLGDRVNIFLLCHSAAHPTLFWGTWGKSLFKWSNRWEVSIQAILSD